MSSRVAAVVFALTAAIVPSGMTVACGGSSPAPSAPSEGAKGTSAEAPAERCLAIAGAKREPKADAPEKIAVRHILVKYAGAKRAPESVTRTRGEACLRALEAREKLEGGASFAEVVGAYSEEPGAATREGSLGPIQRTDVVPPFADAAFELGRGDVSHVVESDYGFHVIQRTE
ncbi:MAG: peptidylprolyl isomerase [Labilithrix sp.]|nr:peptidylprolyl isomerase [Labilithrix sp.]